MLIPDQIQAIDRHLRKENWLLNEDLITELTDHYVAGIEERMAHGKAFDAALREIHADFGGRKGLLAMEEGYQTQKARQMNVIEWRIIRSFVEGPRWFITLATFGLLYLINTYSGQDEAIYTGLGSGMLFVTFSVLTNVVLTIIFFYRNRREVNHTVTQPTPPIYLIAYSLSLSLLLLNNYVLPRFNLNLPAQVVIGLETVLETLCIVYYIAIAMSLRQRLATDRRKQVRNV